MSVTSFGGSSEISSKYEFLLVNVGPLNVKISTNVVRPLKYSYHKFYVKIIIESRDDKCENGLRTGEFRLRKSNK